MVKLEAARRVIAAAERKAAEIKQPMNIAGPMRTAHPSRPLDRIVLHYDAGCSTQPRFTTIDANKIVIASNLNIGTNACASPAIPVTSPLPDPVKAALLVE